MVESGPEPPLDGAFREGDEVLHTAGEWCSAGSGTNVGRTGTILRTYKGCATACRGRRCWWIKTAVHTDCYPEAGLKKITPSEEFKVWDAVERATGEYAGAKGYVAALDPVGYPQVRWVTSKMKDHREPASYSLNTSALNHYLKAGDKVRLLGENEYGVKAPAECGTVGLCGGRVVLAFSGVALIRTREHGSWPLAQVEKVADDVAFTIEYTGEAKAAGKATVTLSRDTPKAKSAWGPVSLRAGDVVGYRDQRLEVRAICSSGQPPYYVGLNMDGAHACSAPISECELLERNVPEVTGKPMAQTEDKELWIAGRRVQFMSSIVAYRWSGGKFQFSEGGWHSSSRHATHPDDDVEIRVAPEGGGA